MKLIKNATIFTGTGEKITEGAILFDEKIQKVGSYDQLKNLSYDEEIDLEGKFLYPGLVDAHCHLGMFEDSLGFEGDDGNEDSEPITPQLRAIDGINPNDRCFSDAIKAGVTTVVTGPGSANPIGGQFAAIKTHGICVDDMVVKAPVAMKFALGENPKSVFHSKDRTPSTRMGTVALIRETLYKAKEYLEALEDYECDYEENDKPEFDIKSESLIPVLKRQIPVKIHAHRGDDICTAIRLSKEFGIDITLEHCTDGELLKDIIKRENIPVMLGPTLSDRSKPELKNLSFSAYKVLSECGISVAIITDHPETTIENLVLSAQMAVKNGMASDMALKGITINAAKNCWIEDRIGSVEVGKDADFCVYTGNIFDFESRNTMTIINGEVVWKDE